MSAGPSNPSRTLIGLTALLMAAVAACALRYLIDRDPATGDVTLAWPDPAWSQFRLTAMVIGALVGAALGISGVLLQVLLRNPLAEPFILGLSSGAGLGVMIALYVTRISQDFGETVPTDDIRTIPAILGALSALAVVYALGQRRGWLDPMSLVLVGVIVSTVCGSGIMFVQHLVPLGLRGEFISWLMGQVPEVADNSSVIMAAIIVIGGGVLGMWMGRAMDAATLGDDEARSVGLAIGPLRMALFMLAGALAATAVALAGPIGFVGLIGPHAARHVLGPRHTALVPGAALAGVGLIVGADIARQAIDVGAGRMPIGIFTALIGGPAFIVLLRSGRATT